MSKKKNKNKQTNKETNKRTWEIFLKPFNGNTLLAMIKKANVILLTDGTKLTSRQNLLITLRAVVPHF